MKINIMNVVIILTIKNYRVISIIIHLVVQIGHLYIQSQKMNLPDSFIFYAKNVIMFQC